MLLGQRTLKKDPATGQWVTVGESVGNNVSPVPVDAEFVNRDKGTRKPKPVPVKVKAETVRESKPAKIKVEKEDWTPVSDDKWTISDMYVIKRRPCDPPFVNPTTGKEQDSVALSHPITKVFVRGNHWPEGVELVVTDSQHGVTVTFPNGDKTKSMNRIARRYLITRFGESMGNTVADLVDAEKY